MRQQFAAFVEARPYLMPLRTTTVATKKAMNSASRLAITDVSLKQKAFLDLRYFDGFANAWFDSLQLPKRNLRFLTPIVFTEWWGTKKLKVIAHLPVYDITVKLSPYDLLDVVYKRQHRLFVLVDKSFVDKNPHIRP